MIHVSVIGNFRELAKEFDLVALVWLVDSQIDKTLDYMLILH